VKHCLAALPLAAVIAAAHLTAQTPPMAVQSSAGFAPIAPLIEAAVARHELPGAVVLAGRGDAIVYHAAFGQRAVRPAPEAMTEDA